MIAAGVLIWSLVLAAGWAVWRREGGAGLAAAGGSAFQQGKAIALRLSLALLAASFLVHVLPVEAMTLAIGPESGLSGIVLASLAGGLLPGGPMTSFPIAIVFLNGGAGLPQTVALIAGWSVFALQRMLAYEAPIMGWRFVLLRLLCSLPVPILAGLAAELMLMIA